MIHPRLSGGKGGPAGQDGLRGRGLCQSRGFHGSRRSRTTRCDVALPDQGLRAQRHLIFGGEEWWWYGTPIRPGDKLFQERRFYDYKVTDTKFAGPTMFSRGDTTHRNQNGALVAKARSTAIRYLAAEAERLHCVRVPSA